MSEHNSTNVILELREYNEMIRRHRQEEEYMKKLLKHNIQEYIKDESISINDRWSVYTESIDKLLPRRVIGIDKLPIIPNMSYYYKCKSLGNCLYSIEEIVINTICQAKKKYDEKKFQKMYDDMRQIIMKNMITLVYLSGEENRCAYLNEPIECDMITDDCVMR